MKHSFLFKLEHILNVLNKRFIPAIIYQYNPGLFLQWQGNHCKQSCIINKFIIDELTNGDFTTQCWEGFFEIEDMQYNHCWNYMIDNKLQKNIICDFTSTITYMKYGENDPSLYVKSQKNDVNQNKINLIGIQEINYEDYINQKEYYTGLYGNDLNNIFKNMLIKSKLWI